MQPNRDKAKNALNRLLRTLAAQEAKKTTSLENDPDACINRCIELVKAEASEAASLIAECAPHGKPMLAQAQKKLEQLEALKMLETVVSELYGIQG